MFSRNNQKYYDLLELERNCSENDIKKSYRKLAMIYHPDRNKDNKEDSEKKFKEISNAYNILSDKNKRNLYDKYGESGLNESLDMGEGPNFDDIFDTLLKKSSMGTNFFGKESENLNISATINITLLDVLEGKNITHSYKKQQQCSLCQGLGTTSASNIIHCQHCDGNGRILKINQIVPGLATQSYQVCSYCSGKGKSIKFGCQCCNCQGAGLVDTQCNLAIKIQPGVIENQSLVFNNQGNQNLEGQIGNLEIKIKIDSDAQFIRKGNHLIHNQPIQLVNALTEASVSINYLNDKILTFQNNDIIYPGKIVVVKGYGLPVYQQNKRGDLIIQFEVIFPKKLSHERKHYLKKILTTKSHKSPDIQDACSIDNLVVQVSEEQTKRLIHEFNKPDIKKESDNEPSVPHFGYFEAPLSFSEGSLNECPQM